MTNWEAEAHKHHVATDGTCYPKYHPLCSLCNPERNGSWQPEKSESSRNGSAEKPSSSGTTNVETAPPSASPTTSVPSLTPAHPGPATSAPSRLIYKGMPLTWASEETVPEHVFHWNDDPRRHPWCPKCRQREAPEVAFAGTTTSEPAPPKPVDWSVKEVPA